MFRPEKFVPIIFDFLSEVEEMETPGIAWKNSSFHRDD
jgi:hypothetical protein